MGYRLVEGYGDSTLHIGQVAIPAPAVIEDDDNIRMLVLPGAEVQAHDWVRAYSAGVSAVIGVDDGRLCWIPTERFVAMRREHASSQSWSLPPGVMVPVPEGEPSYIEMVRQDRDFGRDSGFIHLHCHSDHSPLDGLSTVDEMVSLAVQDGQGAIAITDHGYCSGHPELHRAATNAGVKPIFGLEAYFVNDRRTRGPGKLILPEPPEIVHPIASKDPSFLLLPRNQWTDEQLQVVRQWEQAKRDAKARWESEREGLAELHDQARKAARDYMHLILWALDDKGLRNLWAMSSLGFMEGFYGKPRIDWDVLERYQEGVMASTACLRGPVAQPLLAGRHEEADANLARLQGIFGDRLYVELHTNRLADQITVNKQAILLADKHSVPTIAVVDSHYPCEADQYAHQVWIASQTNTDLHDDSGLFADQQDYHVMTASEVRRAMDYLPEALVDEAMANTVSVADRCTATLKPRIVLPIFTKPGNYGSDVERVQVDIDRLVALALGTPEDNYANWTHHCVGKSKPESVYRERFEREMDLLVSKQFVGYFLMVWEQVNEAKAQGCLVGPGRGSGGASLVAFLLGITEMDPIEHDLLFERFLTEGRDEPPDFDVDYPTSWRDRIQDFCTNRWGEDHTVRVGTILRLKSRGVFSDLARVHKSEVDYADFTKIAKLIDQAEAGTAGFGLSWDDLWAQHGDELEPYREKYPKIFELAERLRGRVKSHGKHAAGLVIAPDEVLLDNLPLRASDTSNQPITQFDMDALTMLGYIKFDILTLRTLDTLQQCVDLIAARRGERINVYDWRREYDDPQVWDEICEGRTKGLFQIETPSGTRMVLRFKPRSIAELADVITLVRPGPVRSGLTEAYLSRRDGFSEVALPDQRLAEVLEPTWGTIIYQEQVMRTCQILGGYSLEEADGIRKILGKKKVEQVEAAGREFVSRCSANGMEQSDAEHLWEQLGEFAKYSFGKSHAVAYAIMGFWTAWFKFHYPIEFLTAALSTVKKERIPEFIAEARRMGYAVLPPDINESLGSFTAGDLGCRYGFSGIDGIGAAAVDGILEGQPYASFDDFMERKGKGPNLGHIKRMARLGVFDSIEPNRRALVERIEWEDSDASKRCQLRDDSVQNHGLPCTYNWDEEPVEIGKTGRPKKRKAPPKRCTKACRRYTAPVLPDVDAMAPFTDAEVREIEMEHLGVHLTTTPFDRIPGDVLLTLTTGSEIETSAQGTYQIAGIITRVKPHKDRNGRAMAFLTVMAQDAELDVVAFASSIEDHKASLKVGMLFLADVVKTGRGINLGKSFIPLPEEHG